MQPFLLGAVCALHEQNMQLTHSANLWKYLRFSRVFLRISGGCAAWFFQRVKDPYTRG